MLHHLIKMIFIVTFLAILLTVENADSSTVVRRRIDDCFNVKCTQSQPTCSVKFRGLSSPACLNSRQIVPPNTTVKNVYIEKNYPVLLHTRFKNLVFVLRLPTSNWVKTKQFSQSPFVVNIAVNNETRGLLFLVCDRRYRKFFLIKIGSSPSPPPLTTPKATTTAAAPTIATTATTTATATTTTTTATTTAAATTTTTTTTASTTATATTTTTTTTATSKWYHLCWLIIIPCFACFVVVVLLIKKRRRKVGTNYNSIEMNNFGFAQNDEQPILDQEAVVV